MIHRAALRSWWAWWGDPAQRRTRDGIGRYRSTRGARRHRRDGERRGRRARACDLARRRSGGSVNRDVLRIRACKSTSATRVSVLASRELRQSGPSLPISPRGVASLFTRVLTAQQAAVWEAALFGKGCTPTHRQSTLRSVYATCRPMFHEVEPGTFAPRSMLVDRKTHRYDRAQIKSSRARRLSIALSMRAVRMPRAS